MRRITLVSLICLAVAGTAKAENTPLHDAARDGNVAAIKALLAAGANINAKVKDGRTPLNASYEGMEKTEGSVVPFQESIEILNAHAGGGDGDRGGCPKALP